MDQWCDFDVEEEVRRTSLALQASVTAWLVVLGRAALCPQMKTNDLGALGSMWLAVSVKF